MQGDQSFPTSEKLKSLIKIKELFKKGSSFYVYPFRILILKESEMTDHQFPQVVVSVPKKKFKKAVDRNRLKRLIREVYRQNKFLIKEKAPSVAQIAIIYAGAKEESFSFLEKRFKKITSEIPR